MRISPLILGSGRAGQAMAKSLAILSTEPEFKDLSPARIIPRGTPLKTVVGEFENPALFIANPSGLHAETILEADEAKFPALFSDKPVCTSLADLERLKRVTVPVAVFHGYRQMWGASTLKQMIKEGSLGDLISIEGRYWQASTAEASLSKSPLQRTWKDDPKLSGNFDVILDLGTHWIDLVCHLVGNAASDVTLWRSFANAVSPHRDSHVHIGLGFPGGVRSIGSVSKAVHGATNDLELIVLGTRRSASWRFLSPDEIVIGEGKERRIIIRSPSLHTLPPFHALGWLEGYLDITRTGLQEFFYSKIGSFPRLADSLSNMKPVLEKCSESFTLN